MLCQTDQSKLRRFTDHRLNPYVPEGGLFRWFFFFSAGLMAVDHAVSLIGSCVGVRMGKSTRWSPSRQRGFPSAHLEHDEASKPTHGSHGEVGCGRHPSALVVMKVWAPIASFT